MDGHIMNLRPLLRRLATSGAAWLSPLKSLGLAKRRDRLHCALIARRSSSAARYCPEPLALELWVPRLRPQ